LKRLWFASVVSFIALLLMARIGRVAPDAALAWQSTDVIHRKPSVTASSTPILPIMGWRGQIVSSTTYATSGNGSIVRVHVLERVNEPITLTRSDTTLRGFSGTKPEYGPYAAEFAPVSAGSWIVSLPDLSASVEIETDGYNLVVVEFAPYAAVEATATAQHSPTSTSTPIVSTPTPTPSSTLAPTPAVQWVGAVLRHDRPPPGKVFASIAVRVNDLPDLPVTLTSGDTVLTCVTGTKPEYGDYACEFGGLSSGTYYITAQGLAPVVPVMVGQGDFVLAEFRQEPAPPGKIVWLGRVVRNSSQPWPGSGVSSAIAVRVEGRRGQVVSLRSSGGWETFCNTGTKPEYGDYACEFGGLWPGVYTVSPVDIAAEIRLYVDGVGFAEVAFEPVLVKASPTPTPARLIGAGAAPSLAGTPSSASTASTEDEISLAPTRTRTPTRVAGTATAMPTRPRPVATATSTPTLAPTPTRSLGWVGRVVRDEPGIGIGTVVVRVLGVKDQPVILRSGPWSARGLTGSKPEYGEHAVEFGGLNRGDFSVELEGLGAVLPIQLQPGGFLLAEFRYDVLPTATPTPRPGVWVGAVTSNTSVDAWSGAWSTVVIKIPGVDGLPITLDSGGGFATTCITGTKPEYGPGACEVGGLWPATYRVIPEGLGPSVDVWLDGAGSATVEFWIQ
jgi:hypothetical protein